METRQRHTIRFLAYALPNDVDVLYRDDQVVPLEPVAVRVLRYLAERHDRVVSKQELLENLWPDVFTTDGVLKRAVSQARRALGDEPAHAKFVATYHGRGYRFIAPVEEPRDRPSASPIKQTEPAAELSADFDQLTGRENELALLNAEYQNCLRGRARPVVLRGPAGIGKTQLARHFQTDARSRGALTIELRFFDYGGSQIAPYAPFIDALARIAEPVGEDALAAIERRWGVELPADAGGSGNRHAGGDPYSMIVPICRCLTLISSGQPLVVVLDDLQWATATELDLVSYLLRSIDELPLMLIGVVRDEDVGLDDRPLRSWMRREAAYRSFTTLDIAPLPYETCQSAIAAVFGHATAPQIPPGQFDAIFEVCRGNPYFLMEILRLLIADGVIAPEPSATSWGWREADRVELPASLVLLSEARLDRLTERVRALIDAAAVVGDEFRLVTLAQILETSEQETAELLGEAVDAGVLSFRGLSPGEDCRFYHTIIRRTVYDQLTAWTKKSLHDRTGRVLEAVYAADPDRVVEAVSIHYEAAGDATRAFTAAVAASDAARRRWEWQRSLQCVERACRAAELMEASGHAVAFSESLALGIARGETLLALGRLKEAEDVIASALRIADSSANMAAMASLLLLRGRTLAALSRYREASESFEQASVTFATLGDAGGELRARIELGGAQAAMGRYDDAGAILERALQQVTADDDLESLACGTLGWATALQGDYQSGAELLERAIVSSERSTNLRRTALLLRRLHWIELTRGHHERATTLALQAREQFHRIGDVAGEAKSIMGLGQARIAQARYPEAIECLHETLERLQDIGDTHCHAETLWLLGKAHLESGDPEAAAPLLEQSLELVQEIGDRDDEFRVMTDIARLLLLRGSVAEAKRYASDASGIARELDNTDGVALALCEIARACLRERDLEGAVDLSRRATGLLGGSQLGQRWIAAAVLGESLAAAGDMSNALPQLDAALQIIGARRNKGQAPIPADELRVVKSTEHVLLQLGQQREADALRREWGLDSA